MWMVYVYSCDKGTVFQNSVTIKNRTSTPVRVKFISVHFKDLINLPVHIDQGMHIFMSPCYDTEANWKELPKYIYNCNDLNIYFQVNHSFFSKASNILPFYMDIHDLYMNNFKNDLILKQYLLEQSTWLNILEQST